ncbi:phosphatase PAP2 family protein [Odoribacter lunatus]|uniref:phosphatase PAP2 family protein n=1 Tax=Odoribacter lunatus TaxID=2941335 RepID=UPI0020415395|nr:phosphatase PAP2 family protein [Odoribacter lunatus]
MLEALQNIDTHIFLFLNSLYTSYGDSFWWIFTAKLTWVPMYAAILYVICKNFRPTVTLFTVIAITLTIVYADQVCATFIRPFVERMRPSNPNNPISELVHIVHGKRGGRYGFPSCHAANSFGLSFFVMLLFKNKLLSFFILAWAFLNSYSRIYIGVHYPGDLLAGMLVGLSGALLIYTLYRYALNRFIDKKLHPAYPLRHCSVIILTGSITTLLIALYSAFQR